MKRKKPVYVLGLGLSHHGSACLLKDGKISVVIEKERITRVKYDGYNDTDTILYCLNAEGIKLSDIDLVVQNTAIGMFEYGNDYYFGKRLFDDSVSIPIVTISHHLAHAYAAIGLSPFQESAVLVLDGNGNPYDECIDLAGAIIPEKIPDDIANVYLEKDSFYLFRNNKMIPVYKDFTPVGYPAHDDYVLHPSRKHSMGNMYHMVTNYCGLGEDPGKLMGLAPYGRPGAMKHEIFELRDGRTFNRYDWIKNFHQPARSYKELKSRFQHYADLACLTQKELERGVMYLLNSRTALLNPPLENLSYSGGVALNAVTNNRIRNESGYKNLFITPAAGDNGISVGCAYYGWMEVLKQERIMHDGNTCFGKIYSTQQIRNSISGYVKADSSAMRNVIDELMTVVPNALKADKLNRPIYKIQFVVQDAGIYSFECNYQQCTFTKGVIDNPDCIIHTDGTTLLKARFDTSNFITGIQNGLISVTGNERYFTEALDATLFMEKGKDSLRNMLSGTSVSYIEDDEFITTTALLLAKGKTIGWFQGGSEFGPRALGHRSILADPRRSDIQHFINAKIKFREDFRPFAPSVLKEDASIYFDFEGESPYMLLIAPVHETWRSKIPGIVHVDYSARIQTVTPEWNPAYYKLLQEYKSITGISLLLNTSFNSAGMPIVETPAEAISMFYETALDILVIDKFIIYKNEDDIKAVRELPVAETDTAR